MRILLGLIPLVLVLGIGCGTSTSTPDGSASVDMAKTGTVDGSLLPLAAMCTGNAQCASGVCAPYKMGAYMLCTFKCTAGASAPQCTSPSTGQCNGMGYCKFPGM
jgi:hypothetical protein